MVKLYYNIAMSAIASFHRGLNARNSRLFLFMGLPYISPFIEFSATDFCSSGSRSNFRRRVHKRTINTMFWMVTDGQLEGEWKRLLSCVSSLQFRKEIKTTNRITSLNWLWKEVAILYHAITLKQPIHYQSRFCL